MESLNTYVRLFDNRVCRVDGIDEFPTKATLNDFVFRKFGIPSQYQTVWYQGKRITETIGIDNIKNENEYIEFSLTLSIVGGKGGFGSLLRAAGKISNTTNKSAMRDLSGRRQRFIQQERDISEWLDEQKTSQQESIQSIQADFKHIKKYGRPREKRMCHKGSQCPYQWKCKFRHPGDSEYNNNNMYYDFDNNSNNNINIIKEKEKQLRHKLGNKFGKSNVNPLLGMTSVTQEQMTNALTMGTLHSMQMKKFKKQEKLRKKLKEKNVKKLLNDNDNSNDKCDFIDIDSDIDLESVSSSSERSLLSDNDINENDKLKKKSKKSKEKNKSALDISNENENENENDFESKWKSVDIMNKGILSCHHQHNIIYSIRQDCDWFECDKCHMASYGPSWHCANKCDFDLCDNCLNIETDFISFNSQKNDSNENDTNNSNKSKEKRKLDDKESQLIEQVSKIEEMENEMIANKLSRHRKKRKVQTQKQEKKLQLLGLVESSNDNSNNNNSKIDTSNDSNLKNNEELQDIDILDNNNNNNKAKREQILKGQVHPEHALDPNEIIIDNSLLFPIDNDFIDINNNSSANHEMNNNINDDNNNNDNNWIASKGNIDLGKYETSKQLQSVGLDALKEELSLLGLKCGGTLEQRAQRLFLLKSTPLNQLPKSHFAKKGSYKNSNKSKQNC